MIHLLLTTWIGGLICGAWLIGFIMQVERFELLTLKGKDIPVKVALWLGAIFWPLPTIWRWVEDGITWWKNRKK